MRIGLADTTFSQVDMASFAVSVLKKDAPSFEIERYTGPGFKDLPVASKKLIEEHHCDIVLAFGWAGSEKIDEQCAMEANIALMNAELLTNKHILKVFVFSSESSDPKILFNLAKDRVEKHTRNALALLRGKEELSTYAGKGLRQGSSHRGALQ